MITVEEIRKKAVNKYHSFLLYDMRRIIFGARNHDAAIASDRSDVQSESFFPLVIRSDKGRVTDDFSMRAKSLAVLIASSKNTTGKGYTLEVSEINSRVNAHQTNIQKIFFETENDYLLFIGKKSEVLRIRNALAAFIEQQIMSDDALYTWAAASLGDLKNEYENNYWQNIIRCVQWLKENSRSNLYIREIPLPVHTKFIEENERVIHSLLSPERLVSFEKQHGLRSKPILVHFRSLSKTVPLRIGQNNVSEIVLPLEDFMHLPDTPLLDNIKQIFIVENEIVYLTFPEADHALCIWGAGYGVAVLGLSAFLNNYTLYYFGDLDEHGFDMLSLYRASFPRTRSFCMDGETLTEFGSYRVVGKQLAANKVPEYLTDSERSVFMELHRQPERGRLEQERISNGYITARLKSLS